MNTCEVCETMLWDEIASGRLSLDPGLHNDMGVSYVGRDQTKAED
jgi:hypothetical protein